MQVETIPQPDREEVAQWFETLGRMGAEEGGKILLSVGVVAVLILLRFVFLRIVDRRVEDPRTRYRLGKASARTLFVLGVVFLGAVWLEVVRELGTFVGLVTAGVAIALRDLVTNLAGWVFILARRPFEVGDRIQLGEHAGDVIDIRVFQFTILEIGNWVHADQSTGRVIHMPNGDVFREPLANYTSKFEYVWDELEIHITFESDWRRAKEILEGVVQDAVGETAEDAREAVHRASRSFLIFYRRLTPIVYTSVTESGVRLSLRYLAPPRARRGTAQAIWERVLEAFGQEDSINFAHPTRRVFHNLLEGKEGTRAEPPAWLAEGLRERSRGAGEPPSAAAPRNAPGEGPDPSDRRRGGDDGAGG